MDLVFTKRGAMADFRVKASKGVLLFGPPGCGKTYLMRAAANELGIPIQTIEGPSLLSTGGDGGAAIKEIFYLARENAPSVVLFDDIDLVASAQDRSPEARNLLSLFLAQLDSVGESERVLVVATTNKPHVLEASLLRPGRFDRMFYVPPPDAEARLALAESVLRDVPTAGVDRDLLARLCREAEGFSSADVIAAVDEAKLLAIREGTEAVRPLHLEAAFARLRPSVTVESLGWSREFIRSHNVRLSTDRPKEGPS
jgi:transitional endoplasmic reticulum ATPase